MALLMAEPVIAVDCYVMLGTHVTALSVIQLKCDCDQGEYTACHAQHWCVFAVSAVMADYYAPKTYPHHMHK